MELECKTRTITGKKVKSLRNQGLIPAEIFGHGVNNKHISVNQKDFSKIYRTAGEHTIINLTTEEKNKIPVLISEVQFDTLKNRILTIDFHQVRMDEKIQTKVPIEFYGEAPATKSGFTVVEVLNEMEIEALPNKIPHSIKVDLSGLEHPGQSVRISDLEKLKDFKIILGPETVIATVIKPTEEEKAVETPVAETAPETQPPPESSEKEKK